MLTRDGKIHPRELKWFTWMIDRQNLSPSQRQNLMEDLQRPPPLEQVFAQISIDDRQRLIDWLRIAMNIDGDLSKSESHFFHKVLELAESVQQPHPSADQVLAAALLEHQSNVQFWQDLGRVGKVLTTRVRWWRRLW